GAGVGARWRELSALRLPGATVEQRVRRIRDAGDRARIVPARGVQLSRHRRRINECVGAVAADDAERYALPHMPGHAGRVIAAVKIYEDLRSLARVEAPGEEGLSG